MNQFFVGLSICFAKNYIRKMFFLQTSKCASIYQMPGHVNSNGCYRARIEHEWLYLIWTHLSVKLLKGVLLISSRLYWLIILNKYESKCGKNGYWTRSVYICNPLFSSKPKNITHFRCYNTTKPLQWKSLWCVQWLMTILLML